MTKLPLISGKKAARAFAKAGWVPVRQQGSHIIMVTEGRDVTLSVPQHKELKRGLLRALIRDAGLEVEAFVALL